MNSLQTNSDKTIFPVHVYFNNAKIFVVLSDGRVLGTPLSWYSSLANSSEEELNKWELSVFGIHWPLLDEDLSIAGMLVGLNDRNEIPLKAS